MNYISSQHIICCEKLEKGTIVSEPQGTVLIPVVYNVLPAGHIRPTTSRDP